MEIVPVKLISSNPETSINRSATSLNILTNEYIKIEYLFDSSLIELINLEDDVIKKYS